MSRSMWSVAVIGMMCIGAAPKPTAHLPTTLSATMPALAPVPDSGAQAASLKTIRSTLFKTEYADKSPATKRALAKNLLQQGIETNDDMTAKFVLLREAADVGAGAADCNTAMRAIDRLAGTFAVDPVELKTQVLSAAAFASTTPSQYEALLHCCLSAIDQAVEADEYVPAERIASIAQPIANKAKNVELFNAMRDRHEELRELKKQWEDAQAALATLRVSPEDGNANLIVAKVLCLVKGNWEEGLPMLARCADSALKGCAEMDLEEPGEGSARAKVGDGWWEQSLKLTGLSRDRVQGRAEVWYRKALPELSGYTRSAVQKRLSEIDALRMKQLHLAPGLVAEMFSGEDFTRKRGTRVDANIGFDWGKDGPGDGMAKHHFSMRWNGEFRAAVEGMYSFNVTASPGARLFIDGKKVIDNPTLSRKRNGERVSLKLSAGLHAIRVEYWNGSGDAKVKLAWLAPGAKEDEIIPGDAFCHDAWEK